MHTIVIKIWRGLVSEVYSDDPNTEIVILDEDRTYVCLLYTSRCV